jgi:hypothetical protein
VGSRHSFLGIESASFVVVPLLARHHTSHLATFPSYPQLSAHMAAWCKVYHMSGDDQCAACTCAKLLCLCLLVPCNTCVCAVQVSTAGSVDLVANDLDTTLAVYAGATLGALTLVASNDNCRCRW